MHENTKQIHNNSKHESEYRLLLEPSDEWHRKYQDV